MKAIVLQEFGGPEVLRVEEIPTPDPGPDEVRVRVAATALNRADLLERQGRYPPPGKPPQYHVPGLEISGVIDAVGDRVTQWQVGDAVMALLSSGGYAQWAVVPERMVMPIPAGLPLMEAAAIPEAFLTAFDALYARGSGRPGCSVLVHAGASGVGTAAIQLARQGRMQVITTVGSQMKAEAAYALGAHAVVNYRDGGFLPKVQEWSQGGGVDVVLDFVGQSYLADNLAALSVNGTLVLIGTLSGTVAPMDLGLILGKRLRIQGTTLRSRPIEEKIAIVQRFLKEAWPLLAEGAVRPVIDRAYPLSAIQDAHRYMASNQNVGKILVQVGAAE